MAGRAREGSTFWDLVRPYGDKMQERESKDGRKQGYVCIHETETTQPRYSARCFDAPYNDEEFEKLYRKSAESRGERVVMVKVPFAMLNAITKPVEGLVARLNDGKPVDVKGELDAFVHSFFDTSAADKKH